MNRFRFFEGCFLALFTSSIFLAPNLLSRIFPSIKLIFFIMLFLSLLFFFNGNAKSFKPYLYVKYVKELFIGIIILNIGRIIASFIGIINNEGISLYILLNRIAIFVFFFTILLFANTNFVIKSMRIYSNLLFCFGFSALLLLMLIQITNIQPIGKVVFELTSTYERYYNNYGLGLVLPGANVLFFPRSLFFYDEPGTFARMLIPAILWILIYEKKFQQQFQLFILILTIFFTFSVGGWLTICIVYFCIFFKFKFKHKKINFNRKYIVNGVKLITIFCIIIVTISTFFLKKIDYNWILNYFFDKFYTSNSSGGARLLDVINFIELISKHPAGLGANIEILGVSGSVGIFNTMLETGFIGICGSLMIYTSVLAMIIRIKNIYYSNKVLISLSAIVLSDVIMSLQRAEMFHIYSCVCIFALFVKAYVDHEQIYKIQNKKK
ncbi:MAG: hypothetical protein ABIM30_03465 [candidate division WOR-3 bacterium]